MSSNHETVTAWTRVGSAYHMLGDKERAKKAFLKALELRPDDEITRQFIRAQGWDRETGAR